MKSPIIRTLAIAAVGIGYSHFQLLAEPPALTPTSPADHGTNTVPGNQKGTGKGTASDSGTTGKIDPNSAVDHGNNNATGGRRIEKGDDTNPTVVTPNTPRRNDPEAPMPKGDTNSTNGVSPTNPADHGNNSSPGVKPGTGTNGTAPSVNSSTGNPSTADHGNNTGKGTNTATEQKSK